MAVRDNAFALDNGVHCVFVREASTSAFLARELDEMRVGTLHCFDKYTYGAVQKSLAKFPSPRLRVYRLKPFPVKPCLYCKGRSCPLWRANAGISRLHGIPFDPMEHGSAKTTGLEGEEEEEEEEEEKKKKKKKKTRVYRHKKIAAVLAIGGNGFTLTNGVTSTSFEKSFNNSILFREISEMNVRVLNCMDERSFKISCDLRKSYARELKKLQVVLLDAAVEVKDCPSCKSKNCHKWKASVGIASRYKLRHDPIKH